MPPLAVFWRRLDAPGHDACRLREVAGGYELVGAAVWREEGEPHALRYRVLLDEGFATRAAEVRGFRGARDVALDARRTDAGRWTVDGVERPDLAVAWLDPGTLALSLLPPRYERRAPDACWYEAPTVGYAGLLEVGEDGVVRRYPGLWERVG